MNTTNGQKRRVGLAGGVLLALVGCTASSRVGGAFESYYGCSEYRVQRESHTRFNVRGCGHVGEYRCTGVCIHLNSEARLQRNAERARVREDREQARIEAEAAASARARVNAEAASSAERQPAIGPVQSTDRSDAPITRRAFEGGAVLQLSLQSSDASARLQHHSTSPGQVRLILSIPAPAGTLAECGIRVMHGDTISAWPVSAARTHAGNEELMTMLPESEVRGWPSARPTILRACTHQLRLTEEHYRRVADFLAQVDEENRW